MLNKLSKHYSNAVGLRKTFSGSKIKVFQRKANCLNCFEIFFSHFSTEFWISPVFVVFCHSLKTYCDVLLITYA